MVSVKGLKKIMNNLMQDSPISGPVYEPGLPGQKRNFRLIYVCGTPRLKSESNCKHS
jgi:hypothetical protein